MSGSVSVTISYFNEDKEFQLSVINGGAVSFAALQSQIAQAFRFRPGVQFVLIDKQTQSIITRDSLRFIHGLNTSWDLKRIHPPPPDNNHDSPRSAINNNNSMIPQQDGLKRDHVHYKSNHSDAISAPNSNHYRQNNSNNSASKGDNSPRQPLGMYDLSPTENEVSSSQQML